MLNEMKSEEKYFNRDVLFKFQKLQGYQFVTLLRNLAE